MFESREFCDTGVESFNLALVEDKRGNFIVIAVE
jgi:hypothetical protein